MTPSYQDTILQFTPSRSRSGDGTVAELRLYDSEAAVYEGGSREPPVGIVTVPRALLNTEPSMARRSSRDPLTATQARELGNALFALLPADVQGLLTGAEGMFELPRRIKVSAAGTVFDELPWETLTDGIGNPLALRPGLRLVRTVPVRFAAPPLSVAGTARVLLVVTNPRDEKLLDANREIEAVYQRLTQAPYEVRVLENATSRALAEELHAFSPHILHYVGHSGVSSGEGNLILHGADGGTEWLCATDLSRMLPLTVRLLCLGTCFTAPNYDPTGLPRFADAPASQALPTCVLNRHGVSPDGASVRAFWGHFYETLAATGGDVTEAVQAGRLAAHGATPLADWASFSLVVRDDTAAGLRLQAGGLAEEDLGAQIRAQFASRFANQMAHQVLKLGDEAGDDLLKALKQVSSEASEFIRQVK
jgi:hypothetical protein